MLTTVVGVCITDTRRPERVASGYNVCARQEQLHVSMFRCYGTPAWRTALMSVHKGMLHLASNDSMRE